MRNTNKKLVLLVLGLFLVSCNKLTWDSDDGKVKPATAMIFSCLNDIDGAGSLGDITYSKETSILTMNWRAARKVKGTVNYNVYDLNADPPGEPLAVTQDTNWSVKISQDQERVFNFYVEAEDGDGETNCSEGGTKFVQVAINREVGAPVMGRTWAFPVSHNRILLVWEKSVSEFTARYDVFKEEDLYNNQGLEVTSQPIVLGNTVKNYFFVDNLSPSSPYKYIVTAVGTSGMRSTKREVVTATTLSTDRPAFNGIFAVNRMGGNSGLDTLEIRFSPSQDASVTGYRLFMYQGDLDYDLPFGLFIPQLPVQGINQGTAAGNYVPRLNGSVPIETIHISNLTSDTNYCFVLRAFRGGTGSLPVVQEENNLRVCQRTNSVKVPTFAGVSSVYPADGAAGFNNLIVNFPHPVPDGVWNKFKISYKEFATDPGPTCAGKSMAGALSVYTQNDTDTSYMITPGINPNMYYCVQVNTVFDVPPFNYIDPNTKVLSGRARPNPPSFFGVVAVARTPNEDGETFGSIDVSTQPATGSWTEYRYEVANDPSFSLASIVKVVIGTQQSASLMTIAGLPKTGTLYVRVLAVFRAAGIEMTDVDDTSPPRTPRYLAISGTPTAPTNDGPLALNIVNPRSLEIVGGLATNAGATWNENVFWLVSEDFPGCTSCLPGKTAEQAIIDFRLHDEWIVPQPTPTRLTTSLRVNSLISGKRYCAQFRSRYRQGSDSLDSTSTALTKCATPVLAVPPGFNGITAAYNRNDSLGFGKIWVKFPQLPSDISFTKYTIAWVEDTGSNNANSVDFTNPATIMAVPTFDGGGTTCVTKVSGGSNYLHCPVTGLAANKRFFFKTRVEFDFEGLSAVPGGESASAPAKTTPAAPRIPSAVAATPAGSTAIQVTLKAAEDPATPDPAAPDQLLSLWNNVFIYLAEDDVTADAMLDVGATDPVTGLKVPTSGDIAAVANSKGEFEIPGAVVLTNGAILRAPRGAGIVADYPAVSTLVIKNLPPLPTVGQKYKLRFRTVYWNGNTSQYLRSQAASAEAAPQAMPPVFTGSKEYSKYHDSLDFTSIRVVVTPPTGECTSVEALVVPYSYNHTAADWDSNKVERGLSCVATEHFFNRDLADYQGTPRPLIPGEKYYVWMRAVNLVGATPYYSGESRPTEEITMLPDTPTEAVFDTTPLTVVPVQSAPDILRINFKTPLLGDFNRVLVFVSTMLIPSSGGGDNSALVADLKAQMKLQTVTGPPKLKGPEVGVPGGVSPMAGATVLVHSVPTTTKNVAMSWDFDNVLLGNRYCVGVLGAFSATDDFSDDRYLPALSGQEGSSIIQCVDVGINQPNLANSALTNVTMDTLTCPDNPSQHYIKLTLPGTVATNATLESWKIFIANGTDAINFGNTSESTQAWQTFLKGDTVRDKSDQGYLRVGCGGIVPGGKTHFLVKWEYPGSAVSDVYSNRYNTTAFTPPAGESNFVWVPKKMSGLSYPYLMAAYEASRDGVTGAFGGEVVATSTYPSVSAQVACNAAFHTTGSLASCGTPSTAKVRSVAGQAPQIADWKQAWWACRQSSPSGMAWRLPTAQEWRRAAKWPSADYKPGSVDDPVDADIYDQALAVCNLRSVSGIGTTGANPSCKSYVGAYDMVGRAREWVDARIVSVTADPRMNWNPVLGQLIDNGIDRLTLRLHEIAPPVNGSGLLMGSDFGNQATYKLQVDAETQMWRDIAYSNSADNGNPITGFRCMGLVKALMPTADQMSLPQEPNYVSGDISNAPVSWRIPEGKFIKETRPEAVRIVVTDDATPKGKIQISWKSWTKSCAGSCTLSYDIYRAVEPNHIDERFATPWALIGDVTNPSPYANAAVPLDPLAVDASGNPIWTPVPGGADLPETNNTCSATTNPVLPPVVGSLPSPTTYDAVTNPFPVSNCFEFDYSSVPATDAKRMYMYMVVAKDNLGNKMLPMVQRFRTPYLGGDFSEQGKASFRLEARWRKASIGAVAETYQAGKTIPQTMVHVPMDLSGHDHDYYMQKYEAFKYDGGLEDNTGVTDLPNSYDVNSGTWAPNLAACTEASERDGLNFPVDCGSQSTSARFGSKAGAVPLGNFPQGTTVAYTTLWRGCRNSSLSVADGSTYRYILHSPTGAEFTKAEDWGDLNFDDTPDQNPWLAGTGIIRSIEYSFDGAPDAGTPTSCFTEAWDGTTAPTPSPSPIVATSPAVTGSRANCISRYGAVDMVGNAWEINAERIFRTSPAVSGIFMDNGIDGLWLGAQEATGQFAVASLKLNLLRGLPFLGFGTSADGVTIPAGTDLGWWLSAHDSYTSFYSSVVSMGGGYKERWGSQRLTSKGTNNSLTQGRFGRSTDRHFGGYGPKSEALEFGGRCAR